MDIEKQTTNAVHSVESNILEPETHVLSSTAVPEGDIERAMLRGSIVRTISRDSDKKQIKEPADIQAAGPTAYAVGQVGGDDFIEGGVEGWKVILGCTLIAASTVGKHSTNTLSFVLTLCRLEVSSIQPVLPINNLPNPSSLAWGVFQEYHSTHFLRGTPTATLSAVGALQNSVS